MPRISVFISDDLHEKIKKYKGGVLQINVSKICQQALEKEIKKLEEKNATRSI